ncbi:hypothetical protein EW146_g9460 [Bondarzewia mesenterica]|uniref:Uncharacterized protein n=1 Tax=Bondarzewia mesenterica TaxID=1095465 RepID=A0A4S4L632_9AGAM|nr:hypothetical protein EW146_g9460 [Bondarzewia mesenterica]
MTKHLETGQESGFPTKADATRHVDDRSHSTVTTTVPTCRVSTSMQLLVWLSFLAFGLLSVSAAQAPTELKIDTTYLPEDCPAKAQKGDAIKVHYVSPHLQVSRSCGMLDFVDIVAVGHVLQTGTLFSNGNKFDSSVTAVNPSL